MIVLLFHSIVYIPTPSKTKSKQSEADPREMTFMSEEKCSGWVRVDPHRPSLPRIHNPAATAEH